ncbi:MAG TPA: SelL-related redox protein [Holophagaceae bacterium]|nr:SelL-related redox protein [Holophagaceae bacterium]
MERPAAMDPLDQPPPKHPRWMPLALRAAAACHAGAGLALLLKWDQPCAGFGGLALGAGLLAASARPLEQWAVLLAGLVLALGTALHPAFPPPAWGARIWGLGWGALFAVILARVYREALSSRDAERRPLQELLAEYRTQKGASLLERSRQQPVLLVFLRHFGCTFCREALAQLAKDRKGIEATGTAIALVHMSPDAEAEAFFATYGLADVDRVSDPRRWLYWHLGLRRGSLWQLMGPKVWWRGFVAGVLNGHGVGKLAGDAFQMPGVFLLHDGTVIRSAVHRTAADRPDFRALTACPTDRDARCC